MNLISGGLFDEIENLFHDLGMQHTISVKGHHCALRVSLVDPVAAFGAYSYKACF